MRGVKKETSQGKRGAKKLVLPLRTNDQQPRKMEEFSSNIKINKREEVMCGVIITEHNSRLYLIYVSYVNKYT